MSKTILKSKQASIPSTHMMVTLQPRLTNTDASHELTADVESGCVNPRRYAPVLFRDDLEVTLGVGRICNDSLEFMGELLVVEEHPVIAVCRTIVEPSFELLDAVSHLFGLRIADKGDEGSLWSSLDKQLLVLLMDLVDVGDRVTAEPL